MPSLLSLSSSISQKKYDVFLSFRGEDTRKNFTDHLYSSLKRKGIVTFRDDSRLEPGETIKLELLNAIQESWCAIIVFSETYAFSSWCLDELTAIVKQKNAGKLKIFPVFYNVDPSDLRKHTGKVEEAFAKHEERYKEDKDAIQRWRTALTEVANVKGWHLNNRHESEFIEDIVEKVLSKLCQTYSNSPEELIGISSRLDDLHSIIDIREDDIRIIGICGMGGVGKTTLARVVYTQLSPHFEGKGFLADVREVSEKSGLVSLQKQLLSHIFSDECFNFCDVHEGNFIIRRRLSKKKLLVVIDDVDNMQHLKCLVGRRDWFGLGSRIIITTRDEHLLRSYQVDDVYKPTTLNAKEALHLFSLKAFNSETVPKNNDFVELSKHVVEYADGLPLALEVLGCFLCGRDADQWRSALDRLKRDSKKEILDRLKISYDGLEETEKNIFLDIACFFNKEEKDFVIKILDACGFFPEIGIDVLVKKSLLKVDQDNRFLWMHDLLQEMGRNIVRQKCLDEPGNRCRLWEERDVHHMLTKNTATGAVEGMVIDIKREPKLMLTSTGDSFLKMKKLRLLKVLYLPKFPDLLYLSNELCFLEWHGYPFKSLPPCFQPDDLVALFLPYSCLERLWKGNVNFQQLKLVNLKGSQFLRKTPDFTMIPNIESLILEGCAKMVEVHPSISFLRRLKLLNLRDCKSLRSLPPKIGLMGSLEKLILSGCSNLGRFPEIDGKMEHLLELYLDGTRIEQLPTSIGHLNGLVLLNLNDCRNLVSLPSSIHGLKCLKTLNLSGCSKVENLPEELQQLEFLEKLDLSGTAIRKPQSFIFQFKNLKVLSFNGCKGSPSKVLSYWNPLPWVMKRGSTATDCRVLTLPPMSGLTSLTELDLSNCNIGDGAIPSDICRLSSLEFLDLSGNNFTYVPTTVIELSNLLFLRLSNCKELKSLPGLLTSAVQSSIDGCDSLQIVAHPTTPCNMSKMKHIDAFINGSNCYRMAENNNALTLLKDYLKVYGNARPAFSIFMPGTEIPESFKFKHHGDESTKIPLPPNIWNDGQWMGVALCCILASASGNDAWGYRECIYVKPVIHGRKHPRPVTGYIFESDYSRCQIMKEHIWLIYWRRDELYPSFPLDENDGETKNSSNTSLAGEQYCDEIEFQFQHYNSTVRPKVKKYGFQILYGKDLEGMDVESTEQHISLSSPNFNDGIHQDTPNGPTGYVFEFEETGSGESGSDEDIPDPLSSLRRPHPKRLENNMKSNKRPREDETHFGLETSASDLGLVSVCGRGRKKLRLKKSTYKKYFWKLQSKNMIEG